MAGVTREVLCSRTSPMVAVRAAIVAGQRGTEKMKIGSDDFVRIFFVLACSAETSWLGWSYFKGQIADVELIILSFWLCVCCFGLISIYIARRDRFFASVAFILSALTIITLLLAFASIYRISGIIEASTHAVSNDPINCLYFSIVTFTTLGYGDFYPTPETRLIAASEAIVGYLSLALLIAVFAHLWTQLGIKSSN